MYQTEPRLHFPSGNEGILQYLSLALKKPPTCVRIESVVPDATDTATRVIHRVVRCSGTPQKHYCQNRLNLSKAFLGELTNNKSALSLSVLKFRFRLRILLSVVLEFCQRTEKAGRMPFHIVQLPFIIAPVFTSLVGKDSKWSRGGRAGETKLSPTSSCH